MARLNAWSNPSVLGVEEAERMAASLEERAGCPDQVRVNKVLLAMLAPVVGERILEAGSGSGVLSRMLAARVVPGGSVIGIDISPAMARAARRRASTPRHAEALAFGAGQAEALPFGDAAFDAVLAARLLLHAGEPDAVLRELCRVVRPGGRVVVMDWDWDTVVVDHPDRELTRRILHWRADHHGGDNWSGRQLYRRLGISGLRDVTADAIVTIAVSEEAALVGSLWRAAEVCLSGGAITQAEHDAWVAELQSRLSEGRFFAAVVYFVAQGVR